VLAIVAVALPVLASVYMVVRVVRQVATRVWRGTQGRPGRRALAGVVALAVAVGLGWAWWPQPGAYRPIQAYERGALQDVLPAALHSAGAAPGRLAEGRGGRARTIWPAGAELPSADRPALAVVLVPRPSGEGSAASGSSGQAAPTWVFPFDRPLPPGEGDNQALAVNNRDGSTVYDVAFALVWADGDSVRGANEAYAFASCRACRTVAVAFQVVLIVGQADAVVPQNLSGAVNYSCVECVTYALAQQLVITLPESLDADSTARLEALWKQIAAFAASIEDVPLSELRARLSSFETQILEVVRSDPGTAPAGSPAGRPSATGATPSQTSAPAAADGPTTAQPSAPATEQPQEQPTATATATATTPATTPANATAPATAEPTGIRPADGQTAAP
jgi:putative peptide zinc metalloprotease protein